MRCKARRVYVAAIAAFGIAVHNVTTRDVGVVLVAHYVASGIEYVVRVALHH